MKTVLLIPPSRYVRDVFYGCWHEPDIISYRWPPTYMDLLSANLKNSVVLDSYIYDNKESEIINKINDYKPKFLVVATSFFTFESDLSFVKKVKGIVNCKTIIFGDYPTLFPEKLIDKVDFLIRGEPDEVLHDFIENGNMKNICTKSDIKEKVFVKELDKLAFQKREINPKYRNPLSIKEPFTTLTVSRGCKHKCKFCTVPLLYNGVYRRRSIKSIQKEIYEILEKGFKEIFFRDEDLASDYNFMNALCSLLNNKGVSWICNCRIDSLDGDLIRKMKAAGCHLIKLGIESKNRVRLNKNIQDAKIINIVNSCKKNGIDTLGHFIIGFPWEIKKDIYDTIEFSKKLNLSYASFDIFRRYPGGILGKSEFTDLELRKMKRYALIQFYGRFSLIMRHLSNLNNFTEFKNKVKSTVGLWSRLLLYKKVY